jgi:hypothetical protein
LPPNGLGTQENMPEDRYLEGILVIAEEVAAPLEAFDTGGRMRSMLGVRRRSLGRFEENSSASWEILGRCLNVN